MNARATHFRSAAIPFFLAIFLIAGLATLIHDQQVTSARSASPPPSQPQFEGLPVIVSFPVPGLAVPQTAGHADSAASGWQVIFDEDWESGLDDGIWMTVDRNGTQFGEYEWDTREIDNPLGGGDQSAWSIGGGQDGQALEPSADGYPANADSWLIAGPISLAQAQEAELSFNYSFHADAGDTFSVLVSTDGVTWEGKQEDSGGPNSWFGRNFALDAYAGQPEMFLAFTFESNNSGDPVKNAAFVDDIEIRANIDSKQFLPHVQYQLPPTPTPTATPIPPTPTATPPSGNFFDDFANDISGWEARRSNNGASYDLNHRPDSDGGRQGQLEIIIDGTDDFVIASPLVPAKQPPYNIEFLAKLKDPKDRHMYGLVFGADWNGGNCAAPASPNCFTSYYELRVQYRNFTGVPFQELKLKRIDGHDASGEPLGQTLVDWIKGGNVGADDWVEIDVYVTEDGTIRLSWNGKFLVQVQDASLIDQPYFGLMLITKENGAARVKYDYFKVD